MVPTVPDSVRTISERLLPLVALAFLAGVLLQVYLAGRSTLGTASWGDHVGFGHALSLPSALILLLAYLGSYGVRVRRLAWLTILTYYATVAFAVLRLSDAVAFLAPLHPVLAVVSVLSGVLLGAEVMGFRLVRGGDAPPPEAS